MKGLILKDLLIIKKYTRTILILIVFYTVFFGILGGKEFNFSFISGMIVMLFAMMSITSFAYDDMAKWNMYAVALPVSRRKIVLSKYLFALILVLSGTILSFVITLVMSLLKQTIVIQEMLLTTYVIFFASVLFFSILNPLIYKFGSEKSRYLAFAIFLLPILVIMLCLKLGVPKPNTDVLKTCLYLSPIFLILLLFYSFHLSYRIFRKKDL